MDETDQIDFVAIEPGLGLKEPQILAETPIENLKPQLPVKKQKPKTYPLPVDRMYQLIKTLRWSLAVMVDHVFIGGFYLLLLGLFFIQIDSRFYGDDLSQLTSGSILLGSLCLFFIIYGFYFLFFKQFKTPTLGQWVVFGDQED